MTNQAENTTRARQAGVAQGPVPPIAYVLHHIKLHDGVNHDDFERFMLEELFPSVDTSPNGKPDQHFLLSGGQRDEYVWMSQLAYSIHHTPLPTWLSARAEGMVNDVRERLQAFGTHTSSTLYYDVTGWRTVLGK